MTLISKRAEEKHPVTGVASGFHDLDDFTNGFHSDQLIIVAARPSMGKTALMLNICDHAAITSQGSRPGREPGNGQPGNRRTAALLPARGSTATS